MVFSILSYAQKKKKQDIASIKDMCGCYEIKFQFSETFSPNKDYEFHDKIYFAGALEWVFPCRGNQRQNHAAALTRNQ